MPFGPGRPYLQVLDANGTVVKKLYLPPPDKGYGEVEWTKEVYSEWQTLTKENRERVAGFIPKLILKWGVYDDLNGRGLTLGKLDGQQARFQDLMEVLATPPGLLRVCPGPAQQTTLSVTDQLLLTGDGVTKTAQVVNAAGDAIASPTISALTRTDWQGVVALSANARTNTWLQSTTLSASPNATNSCSVDAASGVTDPKGGTGAFYIEEAGGSIENHLCYQSIAKALGSPYTLTVYLKQVERTWAFVQIESGRYAYVNLTTGAIGKTSGITSAYATLRADGWVKVVVTGDGTITGNKNVSFGPAIGDNTCPYLGVTGNRILAFLPQHEPGSISTGNIQTTTVSVTIRDFAVDSTGLITLAETPLENALLKWSGTYLYGEDVGFVCHVKKVPKAKLIGNRFAQNVELELVGRAVQATPILPALT